MKGVKVYWTAVISVIIAIPTVLICLYAFWPLLAPQGHYMAHRNAAACLKTIGTGQIDFRENDRDGDGEKGFWRKDVAGLWGLRDKTGVPIRLIELPVASADAAPAEKYRDIPGTPEAKWGYLFRALRFPDEKDVLDVNRWAACAYPEKYKDGFRWTIILSHEYTPYRKDLGKGVTIEVYPDDPVKEGWELFD